MTVEPAVYKQVYYVESPEPEVNETLNPIAIRPCFKSGNLLLWEDTAHGSMRKIAKASFSKEKTKDGSECPIHFSVVTNKGEHINFTLIDLKIYNAKVKNRSWGQLQFKTDQELRDYYLQKASF